MAGLYFVLQGDLADGKTVSDETFQERDSFGLRTFSELHTDYRAIDSQNDSDSEHEEDGDEKAQYAAMCERRAHKRSQRVYVDDDSKVIVTAHAEESQNQKIRETIKHIGQQLRYRSAQSGDVKALCLGYEQAAADCSHGVQPCTEVDSDFYRFHLGPSPRACIAFIQAIGQSTEAYCMVPDVWVLISSYLTEFFYDRYYPSVHFRGNFRESVLNHALVLANRPRASGEADDWEAPASKTEIRRGRYSRVTKNGVFLSRTKQTRFKLDHVSSRGLGTRVWAEQGKVVDVDHDVDGADSFEDWEIRELYEARYPEAHQKMYDICRNIEDADYDGVFWAQVDAHRAALRASDSSSQ